MPSLQFKKIYQIWSVSGRSALSCPGDEGVRGLLWFWIGTHAEYDDMVA